MVKHFAFLFFICFLFSCHRQRTESNLANLIKGDWLWYYNNLPFEDKRAIMTFDDSVCNSNYIWRERVLRYRVKENTLFIESVPGEQPYQGYKYKIAKLTADSLILIRPLKENIETDTIVLQKIHQKNNVKPSAIYFTTSGCMGTCPVMKLEIDSLRNIHFDGLMYTDLIGVYSGKLSQREYNAIVSKIKNLPIDSLKPNYAEPTGDVPAHAIVVYYEGKKIRSRANLGYHEPIELKTLLEKLKDLYKHTRLQYDTSLNHYRFCEPQ